jgi:hypothetical protein
MKTRLQNLLIVLAWLSAAQTALPQGTAFTYQGQLLVGGSAATGNYDFRFLLTASASGGAYVGSPFLTNDVPVSNGLFTVTPDFGAGVFTGSNYWLEVDVCTNNLGVFTVLSPLQPITPVPYAVMANTASNLLGTLSADQLSGAVPASQLSGTLSLAQLPSEAVTNNGTAVTLEGDFSGDGGGLTNLQAQAFAFGTPPADSAVTNYTLNFSGPIYNFINTGNDVVFNNLTGGPGAVSYIIRPNGANRNIAWPTNICTLNTNGLTLSGTNWIMTLTNGNRVAYCSFVAYTNSPDFTNVVASCACSY